MRQDNPRSAEHRLLEIRRSTGTREAHDKELALTPADIPDKAMAAGAKGLGPWHAKLAVGAASTLAVFLAETHNEKPRT